MKKINKQVINCMLQALKRSLVVYTIVGLFFTHHTYAQCVLETLFASDAGNNSNFGSSVAIDGNRMIVGAKYDDNVGDAAGAAYIFRRSGLTWIEVTKLIASDGEAFNKFGHSVDISGNIAIVGAPGHDGAAGNSGVAYIYRYIPELGEWVEQAILIPSHANSQDNSGSTVAISGAVAVIGAANHNHAFSNRGAVYVFRSIDGGQTWEEEVELLAADGVLQDFFGVSVDILDNNIIVGALFDDDNGSNSGSAYMFQYDPKAPDLWTQTQKLLPLDGHSNDNFGRYVSISEDVCAIGATGVDFNDNSSGGAYIFRFNSETQLWIEEAKLLPQDGSSGDQFGIVAIENNIAVIGSPNHSIPIDGAGAVYVYEYQANSKLWIDTGKLTASDNAQNNYLGKSVAVAGTLGIAGSPGHDGAAQSAGALYEFDALASDDSNNNGIPDACETGIGDLNLDNVVDTSDLQILLGFWGTCPGIPIECLGDINGDQIVNTSDLLVLLANWG